MSDNLQAPYEETHLYRVRHSSAHVMAQAVLEMFPDGKYSIGPPIEDGFYYDFELPRSLTPDDLEVIPEAVVYHVASPAVVGDAIADVDAEGLDGCLLGE